MNDNWAWVWCITWIFLCISYIATLLLCLDHQQFKLRLEKSKDA